MIKIPALPKRLQRPPKPSKIDEQGNEICVKPADLRHGDILLSMGTADHSQWIRFLDGGSYSHASYFDGRRLVEISTKGVIEEEPAVRVQGQSYTDVYRFCPTKKCLSSAQAASVTRAIRKYLGFPLATHDLVLCALLVVSRRVNLPGTLEDSVRIILSRAVKALRELIFNDKREHLICSELIYRGFWEARKPGPIELKIFPQFPSSLFRVPQVLAGSPNPASPFSFRPKRGTEKLMEDFAELYVAHKLGRQHFLGAQELAGLPSLSGRKLTAFLAKDPVADYVTPKDLEDSRSLVWVGRACKKDYQS